MSNETDAQLARRIAVEAGELLMRLRRAAQPLIDDAARKQLGHEGDVLANDLLLAHLAAQRPDDAVLSEESIDDPVRVGQSRVWIVDPLDGTAEYRTDRDEFAVHVAIWHDGHLVDGCIALPDRDTVRCTDDPVVGPPPLDLREPITIVVSRSHVPRGFDVICERLIALLADAGYPNAQVRELPIGSVGAKVDEVMRGNAAAYVFSGGLAEWDIAAPFVVAQRQGYVALLADGSEYQYNQVNPRVGSGFVAHPELAPLLAEAVRGSGL